MNTWRKNTVRDTVRAVAPAASPGSPKPVKFNGLSA